MPMRLRPLAWIWVAWALLALWIVVQPPERLLHQSIFIDDTFYSLAAARHLAAGDGSTVDGVHRTNGYQPLWVWLMAGATKLLRLDPSGTARAAVLLCAAATGAAGILVVRLVKALGGSGAAAAWAAALWLLNPYVIRRQLNGLETALAACLLLATVRAILAGRSEGFGWRQQARAGILAGLAGLARTDLLILLPILALRGMRKAALLGAGIAAPWLVWSRLEFGSWIPLSGEATRVWYSILRGGREIGPIVWDEANIRSVTLAALGLDWPARALERLGAGGWIWLLLPAAAGAAALLVGRNRRQAALGYWQAIRPLAVVAWPVAAFQWGSFALLYPAPWHLGRYLLPLHALLVVAAALAYDPVAASGRRALWWAFWSAGMAAGLIPYLWDTTGGRSPSLQLEAARWIREEAPPGARIGMLQSGVAGYFSGREVINLDGKVNPEAMRALRAGRMGEYLREERMDLFGDWSDLVETAIFRRTGSPDLKRRAVRLGGGAPGPPFAFYRLSRE